MQRAATHTRWHLQLIDERDRRIEQLLDLVAILKCKRFGRPPIGEPQAVS